MSFYLVSDKLRPEDPPTLVSAGTKQAAVNGVIKNAVAELQIRFEARLAKPAELVLAGQRGWPTLGIDDAPEPPESIVAQPDPDPTLFEQASAP